MKIAVVIHPLIFAICRLPGGFFPKGLEGADGMGFYEFVCQDGQPWYRFTTNALF